MVLKGIRRVYLSTTQKYLLAIGGVASIPAIGFIIYLQAIGALTVVDYDWTRTPCGADNVACYLTLTATFHEDSFIYPNQSWYISTDKKVNVMKMYRTWGDGLREIPLNETCKGTWCGGKSGVTDNKFAYAFRAGKTYTLVYEVVKENPHEDVKWSFGNLGDKFYIDPTWYGMPYTYNIANETSFINESGGSAGEDLCQYPIAAVATEEAADRQDEWATGAPDCADQCTNWEQDCAWGKTSWANNANLTLTYNQSVYATNITVYYDEYETAHGLYLNNSGSWTQVHSGLDSSCPFVKTFTKTTYLTNGVIFETLDNDWCMVDSVMLCGETQGTAPAKYDILDYDNKSYGNPFIWFQSDDTQYGYMVSSSINTTTTILNAGIGYTQSIIPGNTSGTYYYADSTLDAFVDAHYQDSNWEIAIHGLTHDTDEMMNLSYAELDAKLDAAESVFQTGLGATYDFKSFVAPGCTFNMSTTSLQAYADHNLTTLGGCNYVWTDYYNEWKEEAVEDVIWVPENTAMLFDPDTGELRNLSDIQADCMASIEEKGFCTLYFHVQDFQDPVNATRYARLLEVIDWVNNNQTLKDMNVITDKTAKDYTYAMQNSNLIVYDYDDYYNLTNTTAEILVEGDTSTLTDFQIFNATNLTKQNYTIPYLKFYGISGVNLSFRVGQPLTETDNVGYYFSAINASIYGHEETGVFSVSLNSPANQTQTSDNTTDFNFTVIGSESTYSCELFANSTSYGTNSSVSNNTETTITSSAIPDGDYTWWINCTGGGVTNKSEEREITISTGSPDTKFEVWNGTGWEAYATSNHPMFGCGKTQSIPPGAACNDTDVAPDTQTGTQAIYRLTNNGTAEGVGKLKINTTVTGETFFCDNDNTTAGATTITTSLQDLCGTIPNSSYCDLWCWTNFTNFNTPAEYWLISAEIS